MQSLSGSRSRTRGWLVPAIGGAFVLVLGALSSAEEPTTLTWTGLPTDPWSDGNNWYPPGPPEANQHALIRGECNIDGNSTKPARCLNLYLAYQLNQCGGDLIVDGNMYAGYGSNAGTFYQYDGNTYIRGSLCLWGGTQSTFDSEKGTVVVFGDLWVGEPNRGTHMGYFGANKSGATLRVGGTIHVAGVTEQVYSNASFGAEVTSADPNFPLDIFNDGDVHFVDSNNYTSHLGRLVTTEPNALGVCYIEGACTVNAIQVSQRYVEIWQGTLNLSGTLDAHESNIITGIDSIGGHLRIANSRLAAGFLSAWTGVLNGSVWVDANGILYVGRLRQSYVSVCRTGQILVRGPSQSDDPNLYFSKCGNVENDGTLHLLNCSFEADTLRGVAGDYNGWTIADSNAVLVVNNNLEQAFVTVVASAQVTVKNSSGYVESNVVDGIENDGNFRIEYGTVFTPFVEGIGGGATGRTWIDGDGNLVTGRIVQESVYISDNATLTLVDGGEAYEPNVRTNVYNRGLVHVVSGTHVLGKIVPPEPNVCLGAIIVEPGAALYTTGYRADSV